MHLQLLKAPFMPHEHEFDYDNNVYIKEESITERLDMVCGIDGWSLLMPHAPIRVTDTHWTVTAELSIFTPSGWVSRANVGEGVTAIPKEIDWEDKRRVLNLNQHTVKKAATDALKRSARSWGIGRYLLQTPKNVRDIQGIEKWFFQSGLIFGLVGRNNWREYLAKDNSVLTHYQHLKHIGNTLSLLADEYDLKTITYGEIRDILLARKLGSSDDSQAVAS